MIRKRKLISVLGVIGTLVASMSLSAAQMPTTDWAKSRHDARNSGCSPTTVVAKPTIAWSVNLAAASGKTTSYGTLSGPLVDSNNVYVIDCGNGPNGYWFGASRSGNYQWTSDVETAWWFVNYGGMAMYNDGTSNFVIGGPTGSEGYNALSFLNPATGASARSSALPNSSDDAPTVGPDGTIYTFTQALGVGPAPIENYAEGGTIYAMNPNGTVKWKWGEGNNNLTDKSLGYHYGPMALTTVNGKTTLIVAMYMDKVNDTKANITDPDPWPYVDKNLFALQDEGDHCSVLWATKTNFTETCPALSPHGQTAYVACWQYWGASEAPGGNDPNWQDTLYAYNVADGSLKWKMNTGAEHYSSPAVGADGTVYVTATATSNSRRDTGGKIVAVNPDGTKKWEMFFDLDKGYSFTSPVVTSGAKPVIYFGSNQGRLYAVQDNGASGKVLWFRGFNGKGNFNSPIAPVIADNGTVYTTVGGTLYAFEPGYDCSPIGRSGKVTDKNGNPIANAYVGASSSQYPLADLSNHLYAKTDASGNYFIYVPAGTWHVAAWAAGKQSSDLQTVTMANDLSSVTADFSLGLAAPDLALKAAASTNNPHDPNNLNDGNSASKVFDGDIWSRYITREGDSSKNVNVFPTWLQVDLGSAKAVSESTIYWEASFATAFKIQYSNDATNWSDIYTPPTKGFGGMPYAWITWPPIGAQSTGVDVIKFPAVTARYWRINATATVNGLMSIWEWELRDKLLPESGIIADCKSLADGTPVQIEGKRITAFSGAGIPAGVAYIEEPNRASGIRIASSDIETKGLGIGDSVTVTGTIASSNGEKYISLTNIAKTGNPRPLDALVMNSRAANDKSASGMFVKIAGKVAPATGSESFILNDGGTPIKVYCGSVAAPITNSYVKVRGVLSSEGGSAVLLVGDAMDIADSSIANQPLALAGAKKYFRDCIIAGPFTDSTITGANDQEHVDNLMAVDFLGGEANANPAIGDTVTYNGVDYKWQRYDGANDQIDFIKFFAPSGAAKDWAVAYAVVYIYSPIYQTVDLTLGSDDELRVYVNATQVFEDLSIQGVGYSQKSNINSGAGVDLMPGLNTLVFKVVNGKGGFGLCANIIEWGTWASTSKGWGDGNPIQGLGYYPDKP